MEIILPKKINSQNQITIDSKSIVVIGANGSGKTRFGTDIENRYLSKTHRISAQKSLSMPSEVSPKSKERAEAEFFYGGYYPDPKHQKLHLQQKSQNRWGNKPNTFLLNDFEKLMVLLHTEEYEISIDFKETYSPGQLIQKPITKLDKVHRIWEYVLPHRKLIKKAGSIQTYPTDKPAELYNASEMSDGERVIFYLVGEAVSAPNDSIIIVDEPEMHIHHSITKKLWDGIEKERPDCTFIYLTHDIDFAASRQSSVKIWSKSFNGKEWDYEVLPETENFPEQVYLEILGSRKPILFIEGDESSTDYKLLQLVFPDYTTKPLGSCQKVFEVAKAFNEQQSFHNIDSYGLIDRDRRTDEEIAHITNPIIWVAKVAEIENFLLLEEVVKTVARLMMKEPTDVLNEVKSNIISFFGSQIETQALEHTVARIERIFKNATNNTESKTYKELEDNLIDFWSNQDFNKIYSDFKNKFTEYVNNQNYNEILKVFNNKGLMHNSGVSSLCDLNSKNDAYLNFILGILKKENEDSDKIKMEILKYIENNATQHTI